MNLDYIQRVVSGKVRSVRRRLATALEELLTQELPDTDLDVAVLTYAKRLKEWEWNMEWVEADRISRLAQGWIEQHPGKSMRQLALHPERVIREMGYSMSHNSIQPILGGWKKRTRRFVLQAMIAVSAAGQGRCRTRGCVFPAVNDGLCRACLVKKLGPRPFQRASHTPAPAYLRSRNPGS